MEITGKLIHILECKKGVSQRTGTEWFSQDFVIETLDQYPKQVCFNIYGAEKLAQFQALLQPGKDITVHLDAESREFNGKWYTQLRAWKIEEPNQNPVSNVGAAPAGFTPTPPSAATANPATPPTAPATPAPPAPQVSADGGDQLPF